MNPPRVMLLIDADNVSTDVIEQAVSRLHAEYGALHVRRAYCTAESAVKHQQLFKRLSIRPMVNLAAGKNSTDIALAVDAMDLVLAERPDVVVIASSDSDFAPLVSRLREKGCHVRGVGQAGKTGEETPVIYDDFLEFAHRRSRATTSADGATEAQAARKTRVRKTAASTATAAKKTPARKATASRKAPAARTKAAEPKAAETPSQAAVADKRVAEKPARKAAARKTPARKATAAAEVVPAEVSRAATSPAQPDEVAELLRAMPMLTEGHSIELQKASEQLRRAGLLSKRSTSRKLLGRFPEWFHLTPTHEPTRVTLRHPG